MDEQKLPEHSQSNQPNGERPFVIADEGEGDSVDLAVVSGESASQRAMDGIFSKGPTPAPPVAEAPAKGVKETIESIVIAFILAFVFRAFVVEAFVIPTGSMATTLAGAHTRYTCKECGYTFDLGFNSGGSSNDDIEIPSFAGKTVHPICQNCRFPVDPETEGKNPPVRYGDRILVLKYLYIPWVSEPRRWDVVVFKTPADQKPPKYTMNYIKRLVGLPGEHLMILDGDVYVRSEEDAAMAGKMNEPAYGWAVQTKPRYAQDAMWRLVFDNDYRPLHNTRAGKPIIGQRTLPDWSYPWTPGVGSGWDTGDATLAREFRFENLTGGGELNFNFQADQTNHPYWSDWLAYNAEADAGKRYMAGDHRLRFFYERQQGDGPLRVHLTRHGQEFVAELTPERVRLIHRRKGQAEVEIAPVMQIKPSELKGPIEVDFAVVDYQVTLRLNDKVVHQTTPDEFKPDVKALLSHFSQQGNTVNTERVSVEAQGQKALFSHISLWRDVYYTPPERGGRHGAPPVGIDLGSAEFFVVGDNSAQSADAREWSQTVELPEEDLATRDGRVPERFMLGRAFFVYWPAGYKPFKGSPAVVPNFGEMRMIK